MREIERRSLVGDMAGARAAGRGPRRHSGRPPAAPRRRAARRSTRWRSGSLARHVIAQFRKASDAEVAALTRLCQTIGPRLVLPFAEALSTEDHTHTIRRIRELLISFGAEGRRAVEPLKNSTKPAVRRTAVDLLRIFGGNDALRELSLLLNDADPQVQRDAVRAIVQIGTPEAFAVDRSRLRGERRGARADRARDDRPARQPRRAVAGRVLTTTAPRGALVGAARSHHRRAGRPAAPTPTRPRRCARRSSAAMVGAAAHRAPAQGRGRGAQAHRLARDPGRARRGDARRQPRRAQRGAPGWRSGRRGRRDDRRRSRGARRGTRPPSGRGAARRAALRPRPPARRAAAAPAWPKR